MQQKAVYLNGKLHRDQQRLKHSSSFLHLKLILCRTLRFNCTDNKTERKQTHAYTITLHFLISCHIPPVPVKAILNVTKRSVIPVSHSSEFRQFFLCLDLYDAEGEDS